MSLSAPKFTVVIKGPDGSPCGFPAVGIESHEVLAAAIEMAIAAARDAQSQARTWVGAPVLLPSPIVPADRRRQKRSEETRAKMRAAWARRKAAKAA